MTNRLLIILALAVALAAPSGRLLAQESGAGEKKQAGKSLSSDAARARAQAELISATEEYKASLRELLALREEGLRKAVERAATLKELYQEGLISRRQMEENEASLAGLRAQAEEVRVQIEAADQLLAESLVEDEVVLPPAYRPASPGARGLLTRTALIRSYGSANWSLADAAKLDGFFASRFGRRLPVTAFGQTELHNRWGYDHRHALDVALHPDSAEGQALMSYLQGAGIPFIAFRRAVPGSASGPHIHIGRPSQRISR